MTCYLLKNLPGERRAIFTSLKSGDWFTSVLMYQFSLFRSIHRSQPPSTQAEIILRSGKKDLVFSKKFASIFKAIRKAWKQESIRKQSKSSFGKRCWKYIQKSRGIQVNKVKAHSWKGDVLEKEVTAVLYFLLSESDTLIFRKSEEDGGRELISSNSLWEKYMTQYPMIHMARLNLFQR